MESMCSSWVNNFDLWLHFINYLEKGDQYVITDVYSKAENGLIKEGIFFLNKIFF